jgi:hypothetical protein
LHKKLYEIVYKPDIPVLNNPYEWSKNAIKTWQTWLWSLHCPQSCPSFHFAKTKWIKASLTVNACTPFKNQAQLAPNMDLDLVFQPSNEITKFIAHSSSRLFIYIFGFQVWHNNFLLFHFDQVRVNNSLSFPKTP